MTQATNWTRFYSPKSVAVVGASDDTRRFGGRLMRQIAKFGYAGRILPVNPRLTELNGLKCYPGVSALPETSDHVGVVIAAERVVEVLRECHAIGVQCATVFSAGFAETGTEQGRKLQEELLPFTQETGLRVMGPNCNGPVNFIDHFSFSAGYAVSSLSEPAGNVGLVRLFSTDRLEWIFPARPGACALRPATHRGAGHRLGVHRGLSRHQRHVLGRGGAPRL